VHTDAHTIREKWNNDEPTIGPFVQLPAPGEVEIFAIVGFDFVIVDLEHGALNFETAENMMRAAHGRGIAPLVRVLANRTELIVQALNIGAAGVLVPHVDSAAEARAAVAATQFRPQGVQGIGAEEMFRRGVCPFVRAADYSAAKGPDYYSSANESVISGILLEGQSAYDELDDILAIDSLDLIMVAPYDLSQSLGVTGEIYHESVIATVRSVAARARATGKVVGVFAEDPAIAADWVRHGVRVSGMDVDSQIVRRGALAHLEGFKTALAASPSDTPAVTA
jgi:4-hydroxy-2-oxoheptanedioate aldolase